jgi:hypothetical protein
MDKNIEKIIDANIQEINSMMNERYRKKDINHLISEIQNQKKETLKKIKNVEPELYSQKVDYIIQTHEIEKKYLQIVETLEKMKEWTRTK